MLYVTYIWVHFSQLADSVWHLWLWHNSSYIFSRIWQGACTEHCACEQIQWFWRALRSFDQADRARFLQFVTGTSKVPLQGFAFLEGMNGIQKFQIHRDDRSTDRLPSAHTWYVLTHCTVSVQSLLLMLGIISCTCAASVIILILLLIYYCSFSLTVYILVGIYFSDKFYFRKSWIVHIVIGKYIFFCLLSCLGPLSALSVCRLLVLQCHNLVSATLWPLTFSVAPQLWPVNWSKKLLLLSIVVHDV